MLQLFRKWSKRYLADPELATLWLFLGFTILAFSLFAKLLAPVLVAVVIAYLLQWPVSFLQRLRLPRIAAVLIIYSTFLTCMILSLLGLVPLLWHQASNFVTEIPSMTARIQALLLHLSDHYKYYIPPDYIQALITESKLGLAHLGQWILSTSVASISGVIDIAIYFVLVPLLVYFFLMDQAKILTWISGYLPKQRRLISQIGYEVYAQIGNYVRGKILEMLLVWGITYLAFAWIGLEYAMLLSLLVGVSVIIPYMGAIVVTIPVISLAFLQWGWNDQFTYLLMSYALIILLDANLLAPILFSEAVDLHPIALIIAVLIFGNLLGFLGVFFAIPLATIVKAILNVLSTPLMPVTPQSRDLPH